MSSGLPRCFGLLGHPVQHSASPAMHNAAFAAMDVGHHYAAFDVRPEHLGTALRGALRLGYGGLNLTVPHKRAGVPLIDQIDPGAAAIGAVNTVVFRDGRSIGHNTDGVGFVSGLRELAPVLPQRAVVLGGGGASRAVVHALLAGGEVLRVDWVSRSPDRLPGWEGSHGRAWAEVPTLLEGCGLLINGTTVGMAEGAAAFPTALDLDRLVDDGIVSDLVYPRPEAGLVDRARARGLRAQSGLPMLLWQGVRALELWLDHALPEAVITAMRDALVARASR